MYILNLARAIKKVLVNEIRDFIFENFCNRIGFSKENSYYLVEHLKRKKKEKKILKDLLMLANKLIEKNSDPWKNTIIYIKEKHEVSKAIKSNYLSTKYFWKSKHCDIKSVIAKLLQKLRLSYQHHKTLKKYVLIALYIMIQKSESYLNEKNVKIKTCFLTFCKFL